jgi:hypothetical protein
MYGHFGLSEPPFFTPIALSLERAASGAGHLLYGIKQPGGSFS